MINSIVARIVALTNEEHGATAVEYGIMVALIAAIIVAMVALVGLDVLAAFTTVEGAI